MKFLFGSSENSTCFSTTRSDYHYQLSRNNGAWKERLEVFGKPVLEAGVGFRRVLVTLHDREVQIWNYLKVEPAQNFASVMRSLVVVLLLLVVFFVLSQVVAFFVAEFGYMSLAWYFRYPLFGIASIVLVIASATVYDQFKYEYKLRKAARDIRGLSTVTGRAVESYKDILRKITMCNNEERAETASKLLYRDMV